jgi:hypothetical protein
VRLLSYFEAYPRDVERERSGRKEWRKRLQNLPDTVNRSSEILDHRDSVSRTFLDSWANNDTTVHLHLFGWGRNAKRPSIDVCATFERDPERWVPSKAELLRKTGPINRIRHGLYDVQGSVFVDDVKPANFIEGVSDLPDSGLTSFLLEVPAMIRLHPLDLCPLFLGKSTNINPSIGGESILLGVNSRLSKNGKHGPSDNLCGDFAPESSLEELENQVVKSTTEVVKSVTDYEGGIGVNRLQLTDVKAICKSVVVTIHSNGVSSKIDTTVEFLQDAVMLSGAVHLGYGTIETPMTHAE